MYQTLLLTGSYLECILFSVAFFTSYLTLSLPPHFPVPLKPVPAKHLQFPCHTDFQAHLSVSLLVSYETRDRIYLLD